MEKIRQKGTVLSQFQLKKGSEYAKSRFMPVTDDIWQYRIDGASISFWSPEQSVPFASWRFSSGSIIVDACSMPFIDGTDGVVIAVNNFEGSKPLYFLAYYSFAKSAVVKMITVKSEITCIFIVLGNLAKAQIIQLNQGLRNAPHWIAVGTKGGSCYLTHFNIDSPLEIDLQLSSPAFSTNITKHYIRDDSFVIDVAQGNFSVKLEKISVTALSYIPKCCLLLIGFSCGAVITLGLCPEASRVVYYMYDGPVRSFAWQEPNDDPRPTFYLWIAHDANENRRAKKNVRMNGAQILLTIIVFPEDEGKPFNEWSYSSPRIQRHFAWSPGTISRWMGVCAIVQNEGLDRVARLVDRSTTFEESTIGSSSPDSTLLLMVWVNQKETAVQGALFDLNAFYYKRLVKSVIFDETVAHQCPFLSLFTLLDSRNEVIGIQDVIACPESFIRFSGPLSESNDALFYPSALSFSVVVLKNNARLVVEVRSLQEEVLQAIQGDIFDAVGANVNLAAQWMIAVGLSDANSTFAMHTEWYEPSLIITGLLNHGYVSGLRSWLEESADEASREDFTKFLWDFVQDTKEHFDENSAGLFAKISTAPPKWTMSWLKSAYLVFSIAEELFGAVYKKINTKNSAQGAEIECHRRASSNLALYTRFVLFMLRQSVLPESTNYGNVWRSLKEKVDERFHRALSSGKQLFIHELLEEMKRLGKEEDFWADDEPASLYPPKTLLVLFDPVLALQIATSAKLKLMGYFFLDYDCVTKGNLFGRFRNMFLSNDLLFAEQIVAKYQADCVAEPLISSNADEDVHRLEPESTNEVRDLMKCPLLSEEQYKTIKETLLKRKDGITEWNDFCIAKRQLQRLIEPSKDLKDEKWKNVCDQWSRRFFKEIPHLDSARLPTIVADKWKSTDDLFPKSSFVSVTRRRPKRRTTLHETLIEFKSAMELRKRKAASQVTPEGKRSKPQGYDEPFASPNETIAVRDNDALQLERILPKENLDRVRRILQTPPSVRRFRRPLKDDALSKLDLTPENPVIVQPTSILKSAAKRRLHGDTDLGFRNVYTAGDVAAAAAAQEPQVKLSLHPRLRFDLPTAELESSVMSPGSSIAKEDVSSECKINETTMDTEDQPILEPAHSASYWREKSIQGNIESEAVGELKEKDGIPAAEPADTRAISSPAGSPVKKRKVVTETCCEISIGVNMGNISTGTALKEAEVLLSNLKKAAGVELVQNDSSLAQSLVNENVADFSARPDKELDRTKENDLASDETFVKSSGQQADFAEQQSVSERGDETFIVIPKSLQGEACSLEVDNALDTESDNVLVAEMNLVLDTEVDEVPGIEVDKVLVTEADKVFEKELEEILDTDVDKVLDTEVGKILDTETDNLLDTEVGKILDTEIHNLLDTEVDKTLDVAVDKTVNAEVCKVLDTGNVPSVFIVLTEVNEGTGTKENSSQHIERVNDRFEGASVTENLSQINIGDLRTPRKRIRNLSTSSSPATFQATTQRRSPGRSLAKEKPASIRRTRNKAASLSVTSGMLEVESPESPVLPNPAEDLGSVRRAGLRSASRKMNLEEPSTSHISRKSVLEKTPRKVGGKISTARSPSRSTSSKATVSSTPATEGVLDRTSRTSSRLDKKSASPPAPIVETNQKRPSRSPSRRAKPLHFSPVMLATERGLERSPSPSPSGVVSLKARTSNVPAVEDLSKVPPFRRSSSRAKKSASPPAPSVEANQRRSSRSPSRLKKVSPVSPVVRSSKRLGSLSPSRNKRSPSTLSSASISPKSRTLSRSPSRGVRATSVLSTASAPGTVSKRASSRSPSRASSRNVQRASSEVASPVVSSSRNKSSRKRVISDSDLDKTARPRPTRIRPGRMTVAQVMKTITEEEKATPTRTTTRTRKSPARYPQ